MSLLILPVAAAPGVPQEITLDVRRTLKLMVEVSKATSMYFYIVMLSEISFPLNFRSKSSLVNQLNNILLKFK